MSVDSSRVASSYSAVPQQVNKTVKVDVDIPADRFWIKDRSGNDAQVRLEPNGKVYLCYTARNRHEIVSKEIPASRFMLMFRQFVDLLQE